MLLLATQLSASPHALQTLAISIVAGVLLVLLSKRLKLSPIALLLVGGVLLGPSRYGLGLVVPGSLGPALTPLIQLAVALILFEGGLTLNIDGYLGASGVIRRLLSLGVMITWLGTGAVIWLLFRDTFKDQALEMAMLASSLVIVTGPTVIAPLLRRIRIKQNLNDILHWEGVLIDPIGVFIAILTYEFIAGTGAGEALTQFLSRFFFGAVVGIVMAYAVVIAIKRYWIPEENLNISIVMAAVLIFAVCDWLAPESGLLGVTVAGLVLGWKRPGPLKQIKEFKEEISELLVGALFVVLAAQIDFSDFRKFGMNGAFAVLLVTFVVRPLNILACTWGSRLTVKEKLFLCYVAPRGIVAASMASLFALSMAGNDNPNAWFLVQFTFSVIAFTVILQGLTAGFLAKLLNLKLPDPNGWLIVGAHGFSRRIARFLTSRGKIECILVDVNRRSISEAKAEGLTVHYADARDPGLPNQFEYRTVGNVLALTDNEDLNAIICQRWASVVGLRHVYRWGAGKVKEEDAHDQPGRVVWDNLPKPSLVSAEMNSGDIHIANAKVTVKATGNSMALLSVGADGVAVDPRSDAEHPINAEGEALMLRREAEYLLRSIRPELVVRFEDVKNRDDLFSRLVERAVMVEPRINREELKTEILEREKSFPTALGHGIAVPHGYSGEVTRRLCAVAQIPNGIDFNAPDGEPVLIAFLIVSPKGDPEGHLATMAEVAKMVSDREMRERLVSAPNAESLMTILSSSKK